MRARALGFGLLILAAILAWLPIASWVYLWMSGLVSNSYFAGSQSNRLTAFLIYAPQIKSNWWVSVCVFVSALVATLPVLAVAVAASATTPKTDRPIHGETGWMSMWRAMLPPSLGGAGFKFNLRPNPDALILGIWMMWGLIRLYVSLPGSEHGGLYARTRTGKGIGYVNPNVMSWGGSVVAFSIKEDIWREAAHARLLMGDRCFLFNLGAKHTHRWNPLGLVRRGTSYAHSDVQRTMHGLVPATKAQNPYWENAARRIGTAAGVLISETPGAKLNVNEVRKLIGREDYEQKIRGMVNDARKAGRPYPEAPVNTLLTWLDRKKEEGAAGVRETLTTALQLWEDPRIQAATEESDFDISRVRSERMSVFVCAPAGDLRPFMPIYGLLFDQLVAVNTREEYKAPGTDHIHQCLVKIDEGWALGKRDVIADAFAFTASFGFRISFVLQAKSQIRGIFGEEGAKNIFLNMGVECLFGRTDIDTAKEVSERMGYDTVHEVTTNRPRLFAWLRPSKQSESEAARRRALMLPQEIIALSQDTMVVLRPGFYPLNLKRIVHYKDPFYSKLLGKPPSVPELVVRVERDDAVGALREEKKAQAAALEAMRREQQEREDKAAAERSKLVAGIREAMEAVPDAIRAQDEAERHAEEVIVQSAPLQEEVRIARMASTAAARDLMAATQALEEATRLGVVPPSIQEEQDNAKARADAAKARVAEAVSSATLAAQAVQQAKAKVTQAARYTRRVQDHARGLRKAAEDQGIDWRAAA